MSIQSTPPAYLQVANRINAAIAAGEYPPGSKLPAEPELAEKYGVSRALINRALGVLQSQGLVIPQRGRGTFVNAIPQIIRNAATRQQRSVREEGRGAFDAELRRLGLTPRSELSQVGQVEAPAQAAELLGLEVGSPVAIRRREMFANDVPVQLASSYIPWDIAEGTPILDQDTGQGGLYSRLSDAGHAPVEFEETIDSRMPTEEEAQFLAMDREQRVYVISRVAYDAEQRPVEVCIHVMPAHQWQLKYRWSAS